jgi:YVTN family beta-propeller protein
LVECWSADVGHRVGDVDRRDEPDDARPGPFSVAVSPDGTRLVVTNSTDGTVSLIDTADNKVIATLPVGTSPAGVVFDPTGTKFYVVNVGGSVSVVAVAPGGQGQPAGVRRGVTELVDPPCRVGGRR